MKFSNRWSHNKFPSLEFWAYVAVFVALVLVVGYITGG